MFRKLVIAVITAWAALLETAADAITATLPPPAADSPRLRVVAPGRLCPGCSSSLSHLTASVPASARAGRSAAAQPCRHGWPGASGGGCTRRPCSEAPPAR
jgi:hypothetical protein